MRKVPPIEIKHRTGEVFINGVSIKTRATTGRYGWSISIESRADAQSLEALPIEQFAYQFIHCTVVAHGGWTRHFTHYELRNTITKSQDWTLKLRNIDFPFGFTASAQRNQIAYVVKQMLAFQNVSADIIFAEEEIFLVQNHLNISETVASTLTNLHLKYQQSIQSVRNLLTSEDFFAATRESSVTQEFYFPDDLRTPCKQYLLYFAEFLQQVGISATTDIIQEAKTVLFSVTPTDSDSLDEDREDVLERIRKALQIYLQIPDHPQFRNPQLVTSQITPEVHELLGQVQFFQSQANLAAAKIQLQNLHIANQNKAIEHYEQLLNFSMKQALVPPAVKEPDPAEGQKILGGAATLQRWDLKFVKVELPFIYKWAKSVLFEELPKPEERSTEGTGESLAGRTDTFEFSEE